MVLKSFFERCLRTILNTKKLFPELLINQMHNRKVWMSEKDFRTGESHYLFDFFTHILFVTMHCTICADGFVFMKRTIKKSLKSIVLKSLTFRANSISVAVIQTAIKMNHLLYGFSLAFNS